MNKNKKIYQNQFSFDDIRKIYTIHNLGRILGENEETLINLAEKAEQFYHPFLQKQCNKVRQIDNPTKELKHIQGKINDRLLKKVPLPVEIIGGRKGYDIKDCASIHLNQPVIVKLDIKDCFPNVSSKQIKAIYRKIFLYSKKVSNILTKLTTYHNHIPQGGKHSTNLLNIVISPLCRELTKYCNKLKFKISFWIDDITISGNKVEKYIPNFIFLVKKHGFSVNTDKIRVLRNNKPQQVVGCGVNKKIGAPKAKRQKYREEVWNAILHKTNNNNLRGKIEGEIAHVEFLNPNQSKELKRLRNRLIKTS